MEDTSEIEKKVEKALEKFKDMPEYKRPKIKVAPSIARILNMSHPMLIEHYNLIQLKVSSLSSTQRKRVQARVGYLLTSGKIEQQQIDNSMDYIKSIENN